MYPCHQPCQRYFSQAAKRCIGREVGRWWNICCFLQRRLLRQAQRQLSKKFQKFHLLPASLPIQRVQCTRPVLQLALPARRTLRADMASMRGPEYWSSTSQMTSSRGSCLPSPACSASHHHTHPQTLPHVGCDVELRIWCAVLVCHGHKPSADQAVQHAQPARRCACVQWCMRCG